MTLPSFENKKIILTLRCFEGIERVEFIGLIRDTIFRQLDWVGGTGTHVTPRPVCKEGVTWVTVLRYDRRDSENTSRK